PKQLSNLSHGKTPCFDDSVSVTLKKCLSNTKSILRPSRSGVLGGASARARESGGVEEGQRRHVRDGAAHLPANPAPESESDGPRPLAVGRGAGVHRTRRSGDAAR